MLKTCGVILILCIVPAVYSKQATLHKISYYYNNTTPTQIPDVADGSRIFLASRDKAVHLSKITLASQGKTITLDKLLSGHDANSFSTGFQINSDVTVTTTNSMDVTKNLTGEFLIITPVMDKDPNFLVYAVRGSNIVLDRSQAKDTTIVFLATPNMNTAGNPNYAGFKHIRVENIVQPKTSYIYFYKYLPTDFYADVNSVDAVERNIFSNPLKHPLGGRVPTFFDAIDPLQFSETMWLRGVNGGFQLNVSDSYVDTTTIQAGAVTVTGMTNSQLMTLNSQVNFPAAGGNRVGNSGYVVSTELFEYNNLTIQQNGQLNSQSVNFQIISGQDATNNLQEQAWEAGSLRIVPSNIFAGIYFIQYFNVDHGPVTMAPVTTTTTTKSPAVATSTSTAAPVNPASSSSSSAPTNSPTTSQTATTSGYQTTTKSSTTSTMMISMLAVTLFTYQL